MTTHAVTLVVALCAPFGATIAQSFPPDPRVDAVFADLDRADAPGCALGVYRDGRMLYARGYGLADLERQVPITPGSVFDLGSTSKQFAAATIVLLAQEGKLSLDDNVRRFIPELPEYERPITIRHLLHHTSGMRDYLGLLRLAGFRYDDVTTPDDALQAISRQRALNFSPGDEHLYSNSGYFLLSIIVERATGRSLRDEAHDRIFAPLGMTHTEYLGSYNDIIPNRAIGYAPADAGFEADMPRWLQLGDGAVFTSVEDLLHWEENFRSGRVGGTAMRDTMLTRGVLTNGDTLSYALGLMHGTHRDLATVHHGGSWGGYLAQLLRFPEQRYAVAVLCNRADVDPDALAHAVADIHLAADLETLPVAVVQSPSAGTSEDSENPVATRALASYAGSYRVPSTASIVTLAVVDGALTVVEPRRSALRAVSADAFQILDVPGSARLVFEAAPSPSDPAPRVSTWFGGERSATYERIELPMDAAAGLDAFVGTFHSAELATSFGISRTGDQLQVNFRNGSPMPLRRLSADEFAARGTTVLFTRDSSGQVTGFLLSQGRARNMGFERVTTAPGAPVHRP
jgi:CubicO group peptidase (beta-lactamase class C family)